MRGEKRIAERTEKPVSRRGAEVAEKERSAEQSAAVIRMNPRQVIIKVLYGQTPYIFKFYKVKSVHREGAKVAKESLNSDFKSIKNLRVLRVLAVQRFGFVSSV